MNNKGSNNCIIPDNQTSVVQSCSVCTKKDEEDNYIVFNLLYRIVTGHVFHPASKNDELNYSLDIPPQTEEEKDRYDPAEDEKSSEEKLRLFKEKVSATLLSKIVLCPDFDQLLREVFKAKYGNLSPSCSHLELASRFTHMLGIEKEEDKTECLSVEQAPENNIDYEAIIKYLLNAIRKFKRDIETCHDEINELANHIVSRLFNNHSHLIKKDNLEEDKDAENADEDESIDLNDEINDDQRLKEELNSNKEFYSKSGLLHKVSTAASSHGSHSINGNGVSFLSEKSTDFTSNAQEGDDKFRKASRYASFKSKLPKKATDVLKSWFLGNIQNPYPSHEAKEVLSKMTGLSKKQIQNWFTNSRKRFLEPLKKKLDSSRMSSDKNQEIVSQNDAQSLPNSKTQSVEPTQNIMNIESQFSNGPQQQVQKESLAQLNQMPILTIPKDSNQNSFINPQRISPTPMVGQAMVYQGIIPTGQLNPGGSIVILNPYMMTQPQMMYPYRTAVANVVPINASYLPFSQGNIAFMNQSNMVGGSYIVPIQPMNMRVMGQNLSTNFNTINNNVYNNINNMGGVVSEMLPDGASPRQFYGEMLPMNNEIIAQDQLSMHSGKSRSKPELDGVYITTKQLHKEDGQDQT